MKDNNPAKQEIYNLLHEHKKLREEVIKTPRFEKVWEKYNSQYNPNIDSIIELSIFEEIENEYNVQFSNETKYFYSTIGGSVRVHNEKIIRDDFCSKIYFYTNDDDWKKYLECVFSETFVIKIIHKLHQLSDEEINELTSKIREKAGINYKLDSREELLTFILDSGGVYYDRKLNIFKNDFIQNCYQELNSDENMIYHLLFLWGHCGGVCYLILHENYEDLMCFESGNPPYIDYKGYKQYYRLFESDFDPNTEITFLLLNYKSIILESIKILQNILEGKGMRDLIALLYSNVSGMIPIPVEISDKDIIRVHKMT